jgi:hypothetical protein
LPAIGISISFCPLDALRGFLADFFGTFVSAAAPPTFRRSASFADTRYGDELCAWIRLRERKSVTAD